MARETVSIEVLTGTFENQPLVYAHLLDHTLARGQEMDLDYAEVINKVDPTPRLAHVFHKDVVNQLIDAMGLDTTLVLIFPECLDTPLGRHPQVAQPRYLERNAP